MNYNSDGNIINNCQQNSKDQLYLTHNHVDNQKYNPYNDEKLNYDDFIEHKLLK